MRKHCKRLKIILSVLVIFSVSSCAGIQPISTQTMDFEEGIKALAVNLADQLEKSSIGSILNKVVINPVTQQKQLKKIVIDPFIDAESGYPVKVNPRITAIMSQEIEKRFEITGEMEPEKLEISEYVLNGMVTLEERSEGNGNVYKVYATVFEKYSGNVLASASARVSIFDTTPMDIYKDSPVYLKGKNYEQYATSVKKQPNETVSQDYHDRLTVKSMRVKGDNLYEQNEYKKSLSYYNQAAGSQTGDQMEVLNGQFVILVKQGQWADAEAVYGRLVRVSIAETNEIATKIVFDPNSSAPVENKANINNIYMKQIANLVASIRGCRVKIIGHSSRSGSEIYNDKLSLQRAIWIQNKMASIAHGIMNKTEAIGRGFQENIVGTGKDDITDQIDRRVEFKFDRCAE
jgi:outer membrane protein OmpA-like peptidoglycan-associated protein